MRAILQLFVALLVLCDSLAAQNQVLVTVNINPPYSHRFADYVQYQNQVFLSLTNTTQQDIQMKVLCEINGQGSGFNIKTRPDYIPNQIITLAPGETRQFNGNALTGYLDRNNTENNIPGDVEEEILRTGLLPQDIYEYCIEVVDVNTLSVLGRRCVIIPIQYLTPPQPNLPWCGEPQNIQSNPIINFSWVPATGGGMGNANLRYDFYLVKVPEGQDPGQLLELAMDGQLPGDFFNWPNISVSNFQYNPLQYLPLSAGQYVWGVVAHDLNAQVGIENEGKSQFCTLILTSDYTDTDNDGLANQLDGADYLANCSCRSPQHAPAGPSSNDLLQAGTDINVGAYTMRILSHTGNGSGTGKISVPGFPGGLSLPILVDFKDVNVNSERKMISGLVKAQLKSDVGFLPEIANPDITTLPFGPDQVTQLGDYFVQNADHLMSNIAAAADASGFQLPLGMDKMVGGQQVVVAITGLYFDATRAALDAALVLNLIDAGTKIALSGRTICLKNGLGLCGEAELYLAENLELPSIHLTMRGLQNAGNSTQATRVRFDKDGFKNLHIEALYHFPEDLLKKNGGAAGAVTATLTADTEKGWTDWTASISVDPFQLAGVNDFVFRVTSAVYDHSSLSNPADMPADYPEGQSPVWTGFFLKQVQIDLPPIIRKRNSNSPLQVAVTKLLIDRNGLTGELNVNNILQLGEGGEGNWQFSVDNLKVKFLKNMFQNAGFNGRLLLPITSNGVNSQLNYSSILSYSNSQFSYQFAVMPKENLEVDLFAALFSLNQTSNISISYVAGKFDASATLNGNFSIGGKFVNDLPRIQLAHVDFQNLKLKTNYPYIEPGAKLDAALGSPPHSMAGLPVSITGWKLANTGIGLQAGMDIRLSEYVGFLPNAQSAFTVYGKFTNAAPVFDHFEVDKIKLDADFSALKVTGELQFFHKDQSWGEGFAGKVEAVFPPGFAVSSRMQVGDKNGTGYWYVDGQTAVSSDFVSGLKAFGFSGGAYYNLSPNGFKKQTNVADTRNPDDFNQPGGAPSGVQYHVSNGSSGMLASLVIGLGTKELFNANGSLEVAYKNGGIDLMHIAGDARMFGDPGEKGMVNGWIDVKYDFPQKIFDLATSLTLTLPVFEGTGFLSLHSNGTTKEWNFKLGRPLGWTPGSPCVISVNLGPFDVNAGAYFQCGNYEVDGLPKMLPGFMQQLFPEYPKGYVRKVNEMLMANGKTIALGAYFLANFKQNYLIFYGEITAAFGFDLQLREERSACGNIDPPGLNGWYGQGQFYAGIKAAIGVEVDLFLIHGKFEVLSVAVGALLKGGGPNPTWVMGTVSGGFSILGGLIEGHCSFTFEAGEKCIFAHNPLDDLKIINELTPKPDGQGDQVNAAQSVDTDPAVTVNLRMGKEFFLDEIYKNDKGEQVTKPRLFKFEQSNLKVETFRQVSTGYNVPFEKELDPEGYGLIIWRKEMLLPRQDYMVTFTANILECSNVSKEALSEDGQSGHVLYYGTCAGNWNPAQKNGKEFKEVRNLRFKTDGGLIRLNPDKVVYSLPHHGQQFFCYQDISEQAILALSESQGAANFMGNPANESAPKTIKVRLVPHGADAEAMEWIPVEQVANTKVDPALLGNYSEDYQASRPLAYWSAFKYRMLQPNTTYGVQFFIEWEVPPVQNNGGQANTIATKVKARTVLLAAEGNVQVNERELNLEKYKLRRNQREIYRYYFRTSSFSGIEQKLSALECNQLNFKEYKGDRNQDYFPLQICSPDSRNWATVAQRLKNHYPSDILQPVSGDGRNELPKGIFLKKVGFNGAEKFDVFDAYGFERTITHGINRSYRIRPLIELDMGAFHEYWDRFFQQAVNILTQNGIREARFVKASKDRGGWVVSDPKLKMLNVAPPLSEALALGTSADAPSNMMIMPMQINTEIFGIKKTKSQLKAVPGIYQCDPNLIEITRDLEARPGIEPGGIQLGNSWLNDILQTHGGIISDVPGQFLQHQFMSNIGTAFDYLNQQPGAIYSPQQGAAGYGGVQINILNAKKPNALKIGRR